ncbi:hypothetical protein RIF29_41788 [Crotalaria pallida]|uniref:Ribosomal protein L38 n=1 Tax=Crotalaria pallida TaxID=3830 RepID=A0AAN9HT26_CROPI
MASCHCAIYTIYWLLNLCKDHLLLPINVKVDFTLVAMERSMRSLLLVVVCSGTTNSSTAYWDPMDEVKLDAGQQVGIQLDSGQPNIWSITLLYHAKQIHEIKEFLLTTKRKDARFVKIKRSKDVVKFKVRCSKYLYTLCVFNTEKADKLKQLLPSGWVVVVEMVVLVVMREKGLAKHDDGEEVESWSSMANGGDDGN